MDGAFVSKNRKYPSYTTAQLETMVENIKQNQTGSDACMRMISIQDEIERRKSGVSIALVVPQIKRFLPTMENVEAERIAASGEALAANLGERLRTPLSSVSRITGDIEKTSPLFRESPANPQKNLF